MTFLPKGWSTSGVDPRKLSEYTRRPDRWDKEDWRMVVEDIDSLAAAREAIADAAPTGMPALADAFWTFLKVEPELAERGEVRPSHLINLLVAEEMEKLRETDRLRRHTVGDLVGAAMAAVSIEPDLETLFDKAQKMIEAAQQLDQAMQALAQASQDQHDLEDVIKRWSENVDPDDMSDEEKQQGKDYQEQWEAMQQAAEAARQAAQQAGESLEQSMEGGTAGVRETLRGAIEKAADEAESMSEQCDSWGLDPGTLQRMNAQERIELARRLNNPRFKRIADLFGAMRNMMLTEVTRRTIAANEEVFDVSIGDDLDRILPEQLVELSNPATRLDFLRKFAEGELLQYEMQGTEKLAQGAIIFCEDGSGSMSGERELWAKAVMLCLLHLARMQKRAFHLLHFGGRGQVHRISFVDAQDFSIERVLEAAEIFFGGGTDFETPLGQALGLLQDEFRAKGAVDGDIVFCTDGMCGVSPQFMESFKEEQLRLDFAVWGVNIGGSKTDQPLNQICDGRVATIKDLLSGGDVREVFRAI